MIAELGYRSCEIRENDRGEALVVYHRAHDAGVAYEHARGLAASISTWALGEPRIEHLPEQIWTESWKSHFPRLRVGRRLEIKGRVAGITVIDDYGHPPTEVRETLKVPMWPLPENRDRLL